jgi:quercetin dioxygenase-like cupin family protein
MHDLRAISTSITLFLIVFIAAVAIAAGPAAEGHISIVPSEVKWTDAPAIGPGAKLAVLEGDPKLAEPFTMRIKFPANFKVAIHTHPVQERVSVLSGAFYLGIGEKYDAAKAVAYPAGGFTVIPPGMHMFAFTKDEETVVQLNGIGPWGIDYLNPDEDPRKK